MKKKILVADDDPAILDVLTLMLEDAGYDVETSVDGNEVYNMEAVYYPDLLLLDIWMSGSDGRDVCKHVKKHKHKKDIPVIMFSANKDGAAIAREAGAEDFIAKPFEMDELLEKIKNVVYNRAR
jgi:DNA-binding response OmpR family regulator